jgi:hypothetical protein
VAQFVHMFSDHLDHPLVIFGGIILAAGYLTRNVMVPLINTRRNPRPGE